MNSEALLEDRFLFEHWTHDASAIPMVHYPHWKVRFPRSRERILASAWWRERVGQDPSAVLDPVLERIRAEGPLRSADFEHERQGAPGWWGWKPQKAALEFLWHVGELAVARRAELPEAPTRMVLLGPFDPILRDRARALRLFGFDFRFEAFVPEARRVYGYYVMPILEGEHLVGRLDPKFHRAEGLLEIRGLWWEPGIRPTRPRKAALRRALEDLGARLGAREITGP